MVSPAKKRSLTSSAVVGVVGGEPGQGLVEGEQAASGGASSTSSQPSRSTRCRSPPCLTGLLAAGVLDQDAAHGLGGGGEEVAAAVPALGRARRPPAAGRPRGPGPWPGASGPGFSWASLWAASLRSSS